MPIQRINELHRKQRRKKKLKILRKKYQQATTTDEKKKILEKIGKVAPWLTEEEFLR